MDRDEYFKNCYPLIVDEGAVGVVKRKVHNLLEKGHTNPVERLLELGVGHGQHFAHVKQGAKEYHALDLRDLLPKELRSSVIFHQGDAHDLNMFSENSFDRLVATCLIAHLHEPERALKEWRRVTKPHGFIDLWVPCEMGMTLRIAQNLFTGRKLKQLGLNYDSLQWLEHRNHFPMMRTLIHSVFKNDLVSFSALPFARLPWDLQLVRAYRIRKARA